ncbi:uncharacterized protein LOC143282236 [Babylonia areolata]|uniref:uncharacterized protein LOC143282236 n=1 Tax=Babylonia areolata TaxID=304850 RepID=UPI003FD41D29
MTTYRTMTAASTDIDSDDDMESSPFELESIVSIDHMELLFTRHMEILYSDWLEHKIPWENAWTPVWCVLKRNGTVFFTCSLKTHIGTLKLSSGSRFQNGPGNQKEGFRFDLNIHNKKHKFRVKTSHDRELWRAYMVGVITGTVPQDGTLTPQDMQVLLSKFQQHGALYPSPASHSSTPTIPSPAPSVNTPPSADNRPSASVSTKAAIEDSDLQLESSTVRHRSATGTISSRISEYESLRVRSRDNRILEWPSRGLGPSIIGRGENRLSLGFSSDSDSGVSDISWRPFMHHKFDLYGNTNPPSWFFENCNRELAEKILKECRAMGNTLMRVSTAARPSGSYVISKRLDSAEEILHYEVIRVAEGYKFITEDVTNTMETLDEVMDVFIQLSGPYTTRLMKTHDLKELGVGYDAYSRDTVPPVLEPGDLKPRISDRLPVPRMPDRTRALPGADALTERFIRPDLHCLYARRLPYRTMDEIPPALRHPTHRTPGKEKSGIGQRHQLNTHTEEMEGNSVSQQHEQTHPAWDSSNKTEQSIDQHSAVESGDAIYKDLASNVDLGSSDTTCVEDVKNAHETEVQEAADLETSSEMQTVISGVESDDPFIIWCDDGDESCKSQCSYCSTIDSTSSASSHTDFEQSDYSDENSDEKVSTGDMCHTLDQYRSPIFVEEWQASIVFDREGGCLKQNNSDVVLRVPPEAVEGNSVEVHAAVCANVDHVRDVLKLPDDAEVISPVAEYWAGEDFRFLRPVTVELPHILPSDYDQESVRVYHVSRNQEGNVCMSRLEHEKGDMHDTSGGEIFTHGQFLDVHQDKVAPSPVNDETVFNMESEAGTSTGEENSPDLTERLGGFRISPEGIVTVSTYGFCGYVCVYCNAKETKKRPELYVMGCVSDSSERLMEISVFVWDARLKISDFRKEYRVEPGDNRQRLILLDNLSNSKLHMRLLLSNSSGFSHCLAQHGGPLLPESKVEDSAICAGVEVNSYKSTTESIV